MVGDVHQQAGFTTGTVTDDDQLSADLSHGWGSRATDLGGWKMEGGFRQGVFREYARKEENEKSKGLMDYFS